MKRVIDEKTLKALYPPMETAFEAQMRQTLRSLPVERRHRGARRKRAAVHHHYSLFSILFYLQPYWLLIALTSARIPATMMSVWVPQPQVSLPDAHFRPT